jgi:DNA-binding NtrC family response regulator
MELLGASRGHWPLVPVVLLTAYGSVEAAVAAMKSGAFDFLTKPVDTDHLLLVVEKALDSCRRERLSGAMAADLARFPAFQGILGKSDAIMKAQEQAARIAPTGTTCLILGETGVGKELFARGIHAASPRKDQPFVAVNCAAIPESLLENELFGHEKGAYTGAHETSMGKFEYANRGTVFLDEIAEMGPSLQAKLLRVLEDRTFFRIGGTRPVSVDVRVLCATNKDLEAMVAAGGFRQDLYYRLSAFPIRVPPLSERRDDVPELARHFLPHYGRELSRSDLAYDGDALEWLTRQDWPGNVRELMNHIERAAILAGPDGTITADLLKSGETGARAGSSAGLPFGLIDDPEAWLHAETAWRASEVLRRCGGDKKRAARILGVPKTKLEDLLKEEDPHA